MANQITKAPIRPQKARKIYDFFSSFYDYLTRYEDEAKRIGLKLASNKPGDAVLEVGFGTGHTLAEFAIRSRGEGRVCGIEISPKMLTRTRLFLKRYGLSKRVDLQIGDTRNLPFDDDVFNVAFSSYMLDLIDTPEIPLVLKEFKRVLKPGGQLVLVSMSKGKKWYSNMKVYEGIYCCFPFFLGGCRPVLIKQYLPKLGFNNVKREFVLAGRIMPTEIVWGYKPKT